MAKAARNQDLSNLSKRILNYLSGAVQIPVSLSNRLECEAPSSITPINLGTESKKIGNAPSKYFKEQFLNLLSIKCHCGNKADEIKVEHIKKNKQLSIDYNQINQYASEVVSAINKAIIFLFLRCGIRRLGEQQYKLMTLPIAYAILELDAWTNKDMLDKVEYWYWTSLFGGYYRENQNEACISDLKNLSSWLQGSSNPFEGRKSSTLAAENYSDFTTLIGENEEYSVKKAISNGLNQYILSNQPYDLSEEDNRLRSWGTALSEGYDIHVHHVIPLQNKATMDISSKEIRKDEGHILNSPLNLSPISAKANNAIGSLPPSDYLEYIDEVATWGHYLPPVEEFSQKTDESENDYYRRLLKSRYVNLKHRITTEVESLL